MGGTKSEKLQNRRKGEDSASVEEPETVIGTEEKSHGLVTIQGGNYQDYFARKMAELKARGKTTYNPPDLGSDSEGSHKVEQTDAEAGAAETELSKEEDAILEKKRRKKEKKERKKLKQEDASSSSSASSRAPSESPLEGNNATEEDVKEEPTEKKKKKKSKDSEKSATKAEDQVGLDHDHITSQDAQPKKKAK